MSLVFWGRSPASGELARGCKIEAQVEEPREAVKLSPGQSAVRAHPHFVNSTDSLEEVQREGFPSPTVVGTTSLAIVKYTSIWQMELKPT